MRLIDADAYSAEMKQRQEACKEWFFMVEDRELENRAIGMLDAFIEAKLTLDSMPTVDAVPVVHGRWEITPVYIKCSECGEAFMLIPQNYCPHCGAKMDEVSE